MASSSAGIVAGLTAAALATVGFLGWQASARGPAGPGDTAKPTVPPAVSASKAPRDKKNPTALPDGTGSGPRVVYSLDDDRVWLVEEGNDVRRTFRVEPGSVDPAPGVYMVTSRSGEVTGTDGIPVEHVVRFTSVGGVAIGFSARVGPPTQAPDDGVRTGGVRESRPDGDAMWRFATIGRRVVVIR
ncbi:hypothetical protein C3489_10420 [Streptomyces sp. Ru71]|uniref:hypothetical protein n=1 Tax=Streptomyces sp. Ru71 TaxID=2080746 RepID=UPI000CDDAD16|nr:hypothetical protein [Streptomyces sp. Ru71]POX55455.1 hypothetical protein C3489_10420 [Streptomyces sp. Ru71]